jgi:hypothetical protein
LNDLSAELVTVTAFPTTSGVAVESTFVSKDKGTLNHEIAHGLYFTNKEYKKKVTELINNIKPIHYEKLKKKLIKMGYVDDKKIIDDEIHAFMSTGLYNGMNTKELKVYEKEFKNNFKKFNNERK